MTNIPDNSTQKKTDTAGCRTTLEGTLFGKDGYQSLASEVLNLQGGSFDLAGLEAEYEKLENCPDRIEDYLATESNRKDA